MRTHFKTVVRRKRFEAKLRRKTYPDLTIRSGRPERLVVYEQIWSANLDAARPPRFLLRPVSSSHWQLVCRLLSQSPIHRRTENRDSVERKKPQKNTWRVYYWFTVCIILVRSLKTQPKNPNNRYTWRLYELGVINNVQEKNTNTTEVDQLKYDCMWKLGSENLGPIIDAIRPRTCCSLVIL